MATIEAMGGSISGQALVLMTDELEVFPGKVVAAALRRCRQEITLEYGRALSLKAILDRCGMIPEDKQQEIEAEKAWSSLMACFYQCGDCPKEHFSQAKYDKLKTPAMEYAVRSCGGLSRVIATEPEYHGPLRKDFLGAYQNYTMTVQSDRLLGREVNDTLKKLNKPWPKGE